MKLVSSLLLSHPSQQPEANFNHNMWFTMVKKEANAVKEEAVRRFKNVFLRITTLTIWLSLSEFDPFGGIALGRSSKFPSLVSNSLDCVRCVSSSLSLFSPFPQRNAFKKDYNSFYISFYCRHFALCYYKHHRWLSSVSSELWQCDSEPVFTWNWSSTM